MTSNPIAAVSAIVVRDGCVLLVERGCEPNKGLWSFPGGRIELGETAREAAAREVFEETSLTVDVGKVVDVRDVIIGPPGSVDHHYIIINFRATVVSGEPVAQSDAADARWVPIDRLDSFATTSGLVERLKSMGLDDA